ncbi:MAG: sulfatase-like hydrolase/transferase, partial [Actinobacteria bacterium]|nr:sulfatase-like hydrolase/transferase [Actinomycetota bacterium]
MCGSPVSPHPPQARESRWRRGRSRRSVNPLPGAAPRLGRVGLLLGITLLLTPPSGHVVGDRRHTADPGPPSIVLVLTDDQRWDTLWAMPTVLSELVGTGITFTNGFVVNPICCPSRASILTGKYSHSTGVYRDVQPHGGFSTFAKRGEHRSTIATWLH